MTTCDFRATRLDADAEEIYLGNGLGGPATGAMLRLMDLVRSGEVEGHVDSASASAELSGRQLRELLRGMGENSRGFVQRRGHTDEASLQAAIDDDGVYSVSGLEF